MTCSSVTVLIHTIAGLIFAAMTDNAELVKKACLAMSGSNSPELEVEVFGSGSGSETVSPSPEIADDNPMEPAAESDQTSRRRKSTASKSVEMDEKTLKKLERYKKDKQRKNRREKKRQQKLKKAAAAKKTAAAAKSAAAAGPQPPGPETKTERDPSLNH